MLRIYQQYIFHLFSQRLPIKN